MAMSDELLPCPFCGGEAKIFSSEEGGTWDVQCQSCGALPFLVSPREARSRGIEPMDYLVAAWNRRVERTCHMSEHNDLQPRGWYIHYWECSDCHAHYRGKDMPRFCHNCGARVLGGDAR